MVNIKMFATAFSVIIVVISALMFSRLATCESSLTDGEKTSVKVCLGVNLSVAVLMVALVHLTKLFETKQPLGWIILSFVVVGVMMSNAFVASFLQGKDACKSLYESAVAISVFCAVVLVGGGWKIYRKFAMP